MKLKYLPIIAAFVAAFVGGVINQTSASTTSCTTLPDPNSGSLYQMLKYFSTTYSRSGDVGTAKITRTTSTPLCNDQAMVFQSYNMGPNWNGQPDGTSSYTSSLPQTLAYATHFTFGKDETSKTVTVQTPEACKGTQLDAYVGDQEVAKIVAIHDGEKREIGGRIFQPSEKCTTPTPKTPKISITKTVGPNNQETLEVAKDGTFSYTVTATNDGEVDLKSVVISDTAPSGIQFVSAKTGTTDISVTGNKISYTAPTLAIGQSVVIVITAKSTAVAKTPVENRACVTATTPATSNPCDIASTTTPETPVPTKVDVCDASTGNIIQVVEADASKYEAKDSDKCKVSVCDAADATIKLVPKADASKYEAKDSDKCKVSVCDASDGTIKLVPKADASKYEAKDSDKCKVQVCDKTDRIVKLVPKADASKYLPGDSNVCVKIQVCVIQSGDTTMTSIYKDQLDTTKQSTKASDCVKPETPVTPAAATPVAPAVIASTGPEALLGGISSASALTYGAYTYAASRRAVVRNARK